MGQRKGRLFRVVGLVEMRTNRGLSLRELGRRFIPPVSAAYLSQLETGSAMASAPSLLDLARIFGSIRLADEFGHEYLVVYKGKRPPALATDDPQ